MNKGLLSLLSLAGALSACQDYDGGLSFRIENGSPKFDFATTHPISLSIDYGAMAAGAHVSLYLSNPLSHATGPESLPEGEPAFSAYLDCEGRYEGRVMLPAYADQIFVYSPAWGTPLLTSARIEQGQLSLCTQSTNPYSSQPVTRAGDETPETLTVEPLTTDQCTSNPDQKYYTINGGWDGYGKYTDDLNDLLSTGEVNPDQISGLQYLLWGNKTSKPSGLNNSKYVLDANSSPNLYIVEEYEKDGEMHKTKDASVYFTFLSEAAWNENTVGYYFYPKGKRPASFDELKKYIIIPNASIAYHPPFGGANATSNFSVNNAPVGINTRIQLLYIDDEGHASRNFPVGTEIGFFVMCDAFHKGSGDGTDPVNNRMTKRENGKIKTTDVSIWKSDREWNSDQKHHYIALQLKDGTLVYGVEDGTGDKSYEDILFTITATPNEAMDTDAELPDDNHVDPEPPSDTKTQTYYHTYAFEDMWPDGGDYDINDAVIRHTQKLTYSTLNYAKEVEDSFTFVKIADAKTSYEDAFALQLPIEHISSATFTLPEGAIYEEDTHSIILTTDVRELYGKTITMKRVFNAAIRQEAIRDEDFNPYLINQTKGPKYTASNRIEIHLPNHATTSKGLPTSQTGNPWYITLNGKYPYGLSFPDNQFMPTAEGQRISDKYPRFDSWVESDGTKDADWYK